MPDVLQVELDVRADPDRLDEQWVSQPRLRWRWSRELADARELLNRAKADLEVCEAELKLTIRDNPDRFGLKKATEASVEETCRTQEEWQGAKRSVVEAQHEVDVLAAAVAAVDDRKEALENLVRLRLADYYGEPRAPEGARERLEEAGRATVRRRGRKDG